VPVIWDTVTPEMVADDGEVVINGINSSTGLMTKCTIYVRTDFPFATITSVDPVTVYTDPGKVPNLPRTVRVGYNDGAYDSVNVTVTWPEINAEDLMNPGRHHYEGEVPGTTTKAMLTIIVRGDVDPNQEAADEVIALINAIGEPVTLDSEAAIAAARAAYDALTDAQKALVNNYETLQLAEGQYAALQLAADMTAFEAYKTAKKSAMDALLQEGDSEAVQSIVGLAKTQIEGFTYDESKTLDENKAALDTLVANVPNAVAEQRAADAQLAADKAAFEAYKAEKKAAVEAMAQEGDSEAAAQIIADAAAAIDALTYDEAKTLDENKAAVDALADIADALAAQRAADKDPGENPDTPATPADEDDGVCPFCGERHDSRTFIGWVTEYFHVIFFILQKLFFLR
jgi:hypothetical protein